MVCEVRNLLIFGHWAAKREFWKNWDGSGFVLDGNLVSAGARPAVWRAGNGAIGACGFITGMV